MSVFETNSKQAPSDEGANISQLFDALRMPTSCGSREAEVRQEEA